MLRQDYEKQRVAVNDLIDEYNNLLADGKGAESLYKQITDQEEKSEASNFMYLREGDKNAHRTNHSGIML